MSNNHPFSLCDPQCIAGEGASGVLCFSQLWDILNALNIHPSSLVSALFREHGGILDTASSFPVLSHDWSVLMTSLNRINQSANEGGPHRSAVPVSAQRNVGNVWGPVFEWGAAADWLELLQFMDSEEEMGQWSEGGGASAGVNVDGARGRNDASYQNLIRAVFPFRMTPPPLCIKIKRFQKKNKDISALSMSGGRWECGCANLLTSSCSGVLSSCWTLRRTNSSTFSTVPGSIYYIFIRLFITESAMLVGLYFISVY